mgnify:CR=1 FL=1
MRKLSIKDAFTLARIIKSANIKEEIADSVIYNIMVDDKSTEAGYDSLIVKYTSFYNENFKNK